MTLVILFILLMVSFLVIRTYNKAKVLDAKYAKTNISAKELNLKIERVYQMD